MTSEAFIGEQITDVEHSQSPARTAIAYPNMALVKYWGKRDEELVLPVTSSLSMTLDIFPTTTTVTIDSRARTDTIELNGQPATEQARQRVERFLDIVRALAGHGDRAIVRTTNSGPTGAGLASSASGFAALAVAATSAFGLRLDPKAHSRLARRGSGSASRSIFGGFSVWHAGLGDGTAGDLSSFAEPVDSAALDPTLVVAVVDNQAKAVSSREAMRRTASSSPFYPPWATASRQDLCDIRAAIAAGDLTATGQIAERNALAMHAAMLAARPPLRYLSPHSLSVLDRVLALREDGITAYATIDAGPNVAVLCPHADAALVAQSLGELGDFVSTYVAHPGPGAVLLPGGDR